MIPTAEQLDEWFKAGAMKRLGMGSRRACYAIPDTDLCVKCYRSDEEIAEGKYPGHHPIEPLSASVVREIRKCRFDEKRNTCCQECRYWRALKRRLPGSLMAAFPSVVELVLAPSRGWCEVESLVANADGSPVVKFHEAWGRASGGERQRLLAAFERFVGELTLHAVRFYDPQNILVEKGERGAFRLRIVDFEPASRTMLSIDGLSPFFVRKKIERRIVRYRKIFGIRSVDGHAPARK